MVDTAKTYNCPLIVMHIKGAPKDMQKNPVYENVSAELYRYFEERITELEDSGLDKIIIDPGIGFGKRLNDNLNLIRDLKDFVFLGKPVLIGTSRKSFIGQILDKEIDNRLSGSLASLILSIENGADIVRVHDIAETKDAVNIYRGVKNWSVGRME
jgi:dihydropteroate synthase